MTTPKFVTNHAVNPDDFEGFDCSLRTTPVDYTALKKKICELVGGENKATAYAVKLCLHGSKVKEGDYVKIKGEVLTFKALMELLKQQEDYKEGITSQGKDVNKSIVTIRRICRALAANVSYLIKKKAVKVPDDLLQFGIGTGLPDEYCFLDSCYGMDKDTLKKNASGFIKFCENFDDAINEAYSKGWIQGVSGRSHAEAAKNYLKWRGFSVEEEA
jgi:hypothetical protein